MKKKAILSSLIVLFFVCGCMGQNPSPPATQAPTLPSTAFPISPPATNPPASLPATVPATTVAPATPAPKVTVEHYKDFMGVPNDSSVGKLFDLFMKELKDSDDSDAAFFSPMEIFITDNLSRLMVLVSAAQWEKAKGGGLQQISELDENQISAIISYVDEYKNNDLLIIVIPDESAEYGILYLGTDGFHKNLYMEVDDKAILTRLDIRTMRNIGDPSKAESVTLPWQEAAFFYIISLESAQKYIKYMQG